MTQEEKAKRYDEAIKKARNIVNSINVGLIGKNSFEAVFPELKESSDEQIRKRIIQSLHGDILEIEEISKCTAWLEKQAEQKPVTDFSDIKTWKYIVDAVRTEKEGIGQYLDSPFTEEVAKKLQKRFGKIEQKPAETEKGVKGNFREIPFSEQKPAWSEEDEYCRHQLIVFCENCMVQDSSAIRCAHWLKSLKDRCTWKPSYEQMKQLEWVVKQNKDNMLCKELMTLYKDLEKLRGK